VVESREIQPIGGIILDLRESDFRARARTLSGTEKTAVAKHTGLERMAARPMSVTSG
jgi:hypothetical protein